jgi:hypothetical protein
MASFICGGLMAVAVISGLLGCKKEEKEAARPAAVTVSSVAVEKQADGIHLKTKSAEFVLTASGNLL